MARGGYQRITIGDDTEKVNFVSLVFFQWMNNIFKTGSQGNLEESDLVPLSRENTTGSLTDLLQSNWSEEKAQCKGNGKRPKLWKSVLKMISFKDAMFAVLVQALSSLWRILKPLFLGYLISSLMEAEPHKNLLFYGCVMAMGICALTGTICTNHFGYICDVLGIGMSSALKGLIYQKVSTILFERRFFCEFSVNFLDAIQ